MTMTALATATHRHIVNAVLEAQLPVSCFIYDAAVEAYLDPKQFQRDAIYEAFTLATGTIANIARCQVVGHAIEEELVSAESGCSHMHCTRCGWGETIWM